MYSLTEVAAGMEHYIDQIFESFGLKAGFAAIPAVFVAFLGGNWHLFEAWFILNIVDLAFGVMVALKSIDPVTGHCRFSKRKIYGWVVKTLANMVTIIMVGIVTVFFAQVSGFAVPVIDWFMFILLLTEITSILDGADRLGFPVHPLARAIVAKIRRTTEHKIDEALDGAEAVKEDEK